LHLLSAGHHLAKSARRQPRKAFIPKGAFMAFKTNYGMQRADRNRAAQARIEQKQRKRDEKSAKRKAERVLTSESLSDNTKT
jgi:hypothetical protein